MRALTDWCVALFFGVAAIGVVAPMLPETPWRALLDLIVAGVTIRLWLWILREERSS